MIGLYRPLLPELDKPLRAVVRQIHCAGCVAVRSEVSWATAIGYSYESDVLLALIGSEGGLSEGGSHRRVCTAVPVIPRSVLRLPADISNVVAAFTVVVAWAVAADHEADHDSVSGPWLRRLLDPHLDRSLDVLAVSPGRPPDPRGLRDVELPQEADWSEVVLAFEPYVAGLWLAAFRACRLNGLCGDRGVAIAQRLSRVTILADLWIDQETDAAEGRPAPLSRTGASESALAQLHSDLGDLIVMTSTGRSPYVEILRNTFSGGVPTRIANRARRSEGSQ